MRIGGSYLGDKIVLIVRQREAGQIAAFHLPLVSEDDGNIGALGERNRGGLVVSGTVLHSCPWSASLNGLERRGGKPDFLPPLRGAMAGRSNGVAADWIDLRGTAAGDHAHIGVGADDGNGMEAASNQRQSAVSVLQQDNSAFFDFARNLKAGPGIDDAALARMIDYACFEHGA